MNEEKVHPFIELLEKLRDTNNRAALAKLRRGLGKRMGSPEMYPYIAPFLPDSRIERERLFLIGSLFAMHPEKGQRGVSFGSVFRHMCDGSDSMEKRFTNLLSSGADDVGGRLRQAVSLAKSRGVAVDYNKLLADLRWWDHPDRFVQLAWARDFWKKEKKEENSTDSNDGGNER